MTTPTTMNPAQAAATLHTRYEGEPWYRRTVVGYADDGSGGEDPAVPVLYVIVATGKDRYRGLPYQWERYPVLVRAEDTARYAGQAVQR